VVEVAHERNMHTAQTAFHVARVIPCLETILGVGANEDNGASPRVQKFFEASGEGFDLGRADEGPGFWEEDQDEPMIGFCIRGKCDFCFTWCEY
jgi:hypothetical protein